MLHDVIEYPSFSTYWHSNTAGTRTIGADFVDTVPNERMVLLHPVLNDALQYGVLVYRHIVVLIRR